MTGWMEECFDNADVCTSAKEPGKAKEWESAAEEIRTALAESIKQIIKENNLNLKGRI